MAQSGAYFISTVNEQYFANPAKWSRQERNFEKWYSALQAGHKDGSFRRKTAPSARFHMGTDNSEDQNTISDFLARLETLTGNEEPLKTSWKGKKRDLSSDVGRRLLHGAELELASTLGLSCETYIRNRRLMMQARSVALDRKEEFRKTNAQQACDIDVNKASRLWQVFEDVRWFDGRCLDGYVEVP